MPANELTITLARAGRVSVETLAQTLENALEMLRNLEREFVASDILVRWEVVRVSMRSPLRVTVAPSIEGSVTKTIARRLIKTCLKGVKGIERAATPPEHFNEEALDAALKLFEVTRKDGATLTFSSDHLDEITLTEQAARHIEEIASKARLYIDFGTIEGQLEVVSVHEHRSFSIWETFTNRRVECLVNEEQFQTAIDLLGKRVAVTGRVKYRNHVPKSIWVESLRKLREEMELPDLKNVGPIDITGGLSSEEHVRRMRNG
jgi:hypothetical protein